MAHPKPLRKNRGRSLLCPGLEDAMAFEPVDGCVAPGRLHRSLTAEGGRNTVTDADDPDLDMPDRAESAPRLVSCRDPKPTATATERVEQLSSAPMSALPRIPRRDSVDSPSITSASYDDEDDSGTSEDEEPLLPRLDRKKILLDRLMRYFNSIFDSYSPPTHTAHGGGHTTVTENPSAPSSSRDDQASARSRPAEGSDAKTSRKRLPEEDDGDDEGDGGRKRLRPQNDTDEPPMRLACPYFKNNPRRYRLSRSCPGPGWGTVHRVK